MNGEHILIIHTPEMEARELLENAIPVIARDLAIGIAHIGHPVGMGVPPPADMCEAAARQLAQKFAGAVLAACVGDRTKAELDRLKAEQASAPMHWRERWYGSEPERGSAIVTERGDVVAHFGGDEHTHALVTKVVWAHNAALHRRESASR